MIVHIDCSNCTDINNLGRKTAGKYTMSKAYTNQPKFVTQSVGSTHY